MSDRECSRCGACCRTLPIFASREDGEREPRIAREAVRLPEHLADDEWTYKLFRVPFHDRCVFNGPDYRCTIYATRPRLCGDFAPGAPQCAEARGRAGLPPL